MESKEKITHKELVEISYKWVLKRGGCGVAFKELNTLACNREYPDVIGFGSGEYSVLVECKASYSDFVADKNKSFRIAPTLGMGKYRLYCCEEGLIKPEELPFQWGLIYIKDGKYRIIVNPLPHGTIVDGKYHHVNWCFDQNLRAEHGLMYSALRRLFIKGYMPAIYDKDYQRPDADTVINNNQ